MVSGTAMEVFRGLIDKLLFGSLSHLGDPLPKSILFGYGLASLFSACIDVHGAKAAISKSFLVRIAAKVLGIIGVPDNRVLAIYRCKLARSCGLFVRSYIPDSGAHHVTSLFAVAYKCQRVGFGHGGS